MLKLIKEVLDIVKAALIIGVLVTAMATSLPFAITLVVVLLWVALTDTKHDKWEVQDLS